MVNAPEECQSDIAGSAYKRDTSLTWAEKVIGHFNSNDLTSVVANTKHLGLHSEPMQVATERTRHMRLASCRQS